MPSPSPRAEPGSTPALRLLGVPVRFHFTFVLLLIFLVLLGLGGSQSTAMTAVYVAALFGSVVLHELGHAVVGRRYGIGTTEIVLYPIGGISRLARQPRAREELWIALAGPAVNLLIAAALLGGLAATGRLQPVAELGHATDANLLERVAVGNLFLGAFNLLPAFPMDGGRVLRSLLARWWPEERATAMAAAAGRALAVAMGLVGLLGGNVLLVFVALFVYLGATQEGVAVRSRALTAGVPVRAAMVTDFRTLSHGESLRAAGELLLATSQQDFPVVAGGTVLGLLTRTALLRAIVSEGPDAYVAGAMDRGFARVRPDDDLAEAMTTMGGVRSCVLVMDGDRLLGLLTAENLTEFLLLRQVRAAWAATHAPG